MSSTVLTNSPKLDTKMIWKLLEFMRKLKSIHSVLIPLLNY